MYASGTNSRPAQRTPSSAREVISWPRPAVAKGSIALLTELAPLLPGHMCHTMPHGLLE